MRMVAGLVPGEPWRPEAADHLPAPTATDWPMPSGSAPAAARRADLIETLRFTPDEGLIALDWHLARMAAGAAWTDRSFDRHAARNHLQGLTMRRREPARVRLRLGASGAFCALFEALPALPDAEVSVAIRPLPVSADDWRLRVKSSDRRFYDAARADTGAFEVVFADEGGALTEGSFTSIFVTDGPSLLTPAPGPAGLLPGVLRQQLLARGLAREARIEPADLRDGFWIGNSLRGLMPARLAE